MDSRVAKRGQTVNLLATLSKVRILLHPSKGSDICLDPFFCYIIKRQPLLPQEAAVRVRRIRSSASHFVNFYDVRPLRQMPAL